MEVDDLVARKGVEVFETCADLSEGYANTFWDYALGNPCSVGNENRRRLLTVYDLVTKSYVTRDFVNNFVKKRLIDAGIRKDSGKKTRKIIEQIPLDREAYRINQIEVRRKRKLERAAAALENTTSGRKPGPSDLKQARRLREGDDAVVVVEYIFRVRDNAWETGSSKKVQDEAYGVDDDDDSSSNDSSSNENDVFTGGVLHLRAGDNPTTDPTTDIVDLGEVEMGQTSDPFLPSMNLQPLSPTLFVDKSPT